MSKLKKCFSCSKVSCECYQFYLSGITSQNIKEISCPRRKFRTVIQGKFDPHVVTIFKKKLGCGGTYHSNKIELQGKHKEKLLSEIGF